MVLLDFKGYFNANAIDLNITIAPIDRMFVENCLSNSPARFTHNKIWGCSWNCLKERCPSIRKCSGGPPRESCRRQRSRGWSTVVAKRILLRLCYPTMHIREVNSALKRQC